MSELSPPNAEPMPQQPEYPVASRPPHDSGMRLIAGIVTAVVLATGGGVAIGWNLARAISSRNVPSSAQIHVVAPQTPSSGSSNRTAADKVIPAVVDINTVIQTASSTAAAAGTGLILDSTGDVLTNNHVVEGSISVKVSIQGRSGQYTADVVGVDPGDDIAVIHIKNVSGLPTVSIADSSSVQVGDAVYAIGNALGLGGAPRVTEGHVTALDQTIT